ncbi:SRPBCC domain-containing protein [Paenibacillus sp. P26]|nr:SRPBCC domain-containing protein [Paenibacillus sp. P26]
MAGAIFRKAVAEETGRTWEEWVRGLDQEVEVSWSHGQIAEYLSDAYGLSDVWRETLATMYERQMGRKPVGVTASAGVQIGVRRTPPVAKEEAWRFLTSPEGLKLWIGKLSAFELQKGFKYESKEGTFGELRVVNPMDKLRMTWQRLDWDQPSTLQIYLLSGGPGKTTVSFHQEKLEDLYMREVMKRHWEEVLDQMNERLNLTA